MKLTFCVDCGSLNKKSSSTVVKCCNCSSLIEANRYKQQIKLGYNSFYYGIRYREKYDEDLKRDGELRSAYKLVEPSEVLSFIALSMLSGIVGGLAYDLVKGKLKNLLDSINPYILSYKPKLHVKFASRKDITLLGELIRDEETFNKYYSYLRDYKENYRSTDSIKKNALTNKKFASEEIEILLGAKFVYISDKGKCFHDLNCIYLRGAKNGLILKDAILKYSPCSFCKPTTIEQ